MDNKRRLYKAESEVRKALNELGCHIELGTTVYGILRIYVCDNGSGECVELNQRNQPVTDKGTIETIRRPSNDGTFVYDARNKLNN